MLKNLLLASSLFLATPAMSAVTLVPGASFAVPINNDFKANLAREGVFTFSNSNLLVDANGVRMKFEFMASESGFSDTFSTNKLSYTENSNFSAWKPVLIGLQNFNPGLLSDKLNFSGLPNARPATIGSEGFRVAQANSSTFYLFYDDIKNGDGDYDDVIVRATALSVPEPSTWLTMIFGFGLVGYTLRNKPTQIRRMI